ncbi:hypothetical protein HELRODRAFT_188924 [Helobdella robusta]|uniref:Iron-binding zinc finger CDGSH type domain-containing protein n=1 Tax=Helobdella robusta TaxID=6412 RepID=T1FQH4_HELRO|nr:hypothetical protein HELRODRAFT_188924 [Helobdella robusta]ESN98836.1 hypothetical protein HELRODRAFT_188924 [Helobdella robusta]
MASAEKPSGLVPAVAMYAPATVTDLKKGEVKRWCVCGLSKKQPWCDGSHKGTGFSSMPWTVPEDQKEYYICQCKHTKTPPYCDGTHTNLPEGVKERQKNCPNKGTDHKPECKLCTKCGWLPEF